MHGPRSVITPVVSGRCVGTRTRLGRVLAAVCVAAAVAAVPLAVAAAGPAARAGRLTVWDLTLGTAVADLPGREAFRGFACGADGGPPRAPLDGFAGFRRCRPEPAGLTEVYFEYDDELEYIARAHDDERGIARFAGTHEDGFPVMVSALIDDAGILRGIRMVTDARPEHRNDVITADRRTRSEAHGLAAVMASRLGIDPGRDCTAIPPADGETAVGDLFIKRVCEHRDGNRRVVVRASLFRKPGQSGYDPRADGELTHGQFESSTRVEVFEEP